MPIRRRAPVLAMLGLILGLLPGLPAQANSALAQQHGCYNCHGASAGKEAPRMDELAKKFAERRDQPDALAHEADELRTPRRMGRIGSHEHLSEPTARQLLKWLADGAR
jgi:cytochrome c